MGQLLRPGELVVKRVRWNADADLIGLVICFCDEIIPEWLVMWSTADQRIRFKWHIKDALLVVDTLSVVEEVRKRCTLVT